MKNTQKQKRGDRKSPEEKERIIEDAADRFAELFLMQIETKIQQKKPKLKKIKKRAVKSIP